MNRTSLRAPTIALVLLSIGLALVCAEVVFRLLLFSEASFMKPLKRADFYADEGDGDFFKLRHLIDQEFPRPYDRLVGWRNDLIVLSKIDSCYEHVDDPKVGNRTPVLLYGDSFAQCHTSRDECFQGILNSQADFSARHYLVNYGVSGYGIDQIFLLYKHTTGNYQSPTVIVGILNTDLDRSITPVSWGIKPFFTVKEGALQCNTSHLESGFDELLADNPPRIVSYLWRLFIRQGPLPGGVAAWLKSREPPREEIRAISGAILIEMAKDLKHRGIRHVFLVFEWPKRMAREPDWRVEFLVELFQTNNIDFIVTRDAVAGRNHGILSDWENYAVRDGHPNEAFNRLVCEQISLWLDKPGKDSRAR